MREITDPEMENIIGNLMIETSGRESSMIDMMTEIDTGNMTEIGIENMIDTVTGENMTEMTEEGENMIETETIGPEMNTRESKRKPKNRTNQSKKLLNLGGRKVNQKKSPMVPRVVIPSGIPNGKECSWIIS